MAESSSDDTSRLRRAELPTDSSPSPAFVAAFLARAGEAGVLRFDEFVDLALYDPQCGYYRQPRSRVGYGQGSDFYTASTSGAVFGQLVVATCVKLLGEDAAPKHTFVEIGAETAAGILAGVTHPFAAARAIRLGDTLEFTGPCIVFSNELFDAQPFRRFRFRNGGWCELGVALDGTDTLREIELELGHVPEPAELPVTAVGGYTIDVPLAATRLAGAIARQPWTGLFLAFDYGKSWGELIEACPAGTARGYFRHSQTNDLLARPGEQDLTCHICWDWLESALRENGFTNVTVATQEAFLVRNAEAYIAASIAADATRFTQRKQSLMQLLHGAHLGQKFQVLSGVRQG